MPVKETWIEMGVYGYWVFRYNKGHIDAYIVDYVTYDNVVWC